MTSQRDPVPLPDGQRLHLTFDDGPDPTWTPRVLRALEAVGARATFFVLGEAVRRHPATVEAVVAAGHDVGLHGDRHLRHDGLTRAGLLADTDRALAALADLGVEPAWWRAPWGVVTDDTRAVAAARGLTLLGWHADTHDWRGDPAASMVAAVARDAPHGGVVLAHDGLGPGALRDGAAETVAFVGAAAAWADERGLALTALPGPSAAARAASPTRLAGSMPFGASHPPAAAAARSAVPR